ncbi:hypothetical protein K493DRAFT_299448 [Basidiobolus meristosporus CBS 931.73]|uniref:Uncharacterized protein n=1 Tax=Basidiobolus meristosporus CBS 931.73 TaxID=1314790 RepID=A0A1Y1YND5_9FUNG|nr:hypothetical protein K493DRAFT_299448 [Basidiobolus meristosporus CBS 931.73]|eukprot:ORX99343.1 hypothetical protein K493DRAFT_299448 [Basidiobolus meristosporus CBS 931.73]
MSGVSVQNAPSDRPHLYHSSQPAKTYERSAKLQSRFRKLFERSDKKKKDSPGCHVASVPASKRASASLAVAATRPITSPRLNFENVTALLLQSFSLSRFLRLKPGHGRARDGIVPPNDEELFQLERNTDGLERPDPKGIPAAVAGQSNNITMPRVDAQPHQPQVPRLLSYPDQLSDNVARSRASPSTIAYFQGLHKLKSCEHRGLRDILLIHQTITRAHHALITEGLHPESIHERRNSRVTKTTSSTLSSNPNPSLPLLATGGSHCTKRFIPASSPLPPPPYQPCDEDDVPLGVLQLGYKRSC